MESGLRATSTLLLILWAIFEVNSQAPSQDTVMSKAMDKTTVTVTGKVMKNDLPIKYNAKHTDMKTAEYIALNKDVCDHIEEQQAMDMKLQTVDMTCMVKSVDVATEAVTVVLSMDRAKLSKAGYKPADDDLYTAVESMLKLKVPNSAISYEAKVVKSVLTVTGKMMKNGKPIKYNDKFADVKSVEFLQLQKEVCDHIKAQQAMEAKLKSVDVFCTLKSVHQTTDAVTVVLSADTEMLGHAGYKSTDAALNTAVEAMLKMKVTESPIIYEATFAKSAAGAGSRSQQAPGLALVITAGICIAWFFRGSQ